MKSLTVIKKSSNVNMVWAVILILVTAPLFFKFVNLGFYSVQWSFFFFSICLLYLWLLTVIYKGKIHLYKDRVYYFLFLFLFLGLLSYFPAYDKLRWACFWGQFILYFFFAYLVIENINTQEKLNRAVNVLTILISLISICIIVLVVYLENIRYVNDILLNTINLSINKIGIIAEFPLSILLVLTIKEKCSLSRVLAFSSYVFMAVILGSRGLLVALVIMLLFAIILYRLKKKLLVILLLGLTVASVGYVCMERSRERIISKLIILSQSQYQDNIRAFSRIYTAKVALKIMMENALTGVGMGNIKYAKRGVVSESSNIPEDILSYWGEKGIYETTNSPIRLGAEMGIGGFLFFFMFYYYLWKRLRYALNISKKIPNLYLISVIGGMQIGLIVRFLHEMVDFGFKSYLSWFYFGIIIAATRIAKLCNKDTSAVGITGNNS